MSFETTFEEIDLRPKVAKTIYRAVNELLLLTKNLVLEEAVVIDITDYITVKLKIGLY